MDINTWKLIAVWAVLHILVACSGGGDDDGPIGTGGKPINHVITGTAASGKAIANSTVRVKGKGGAKNNGLTDDVGKFTIGLNDVVGTIILRVERVGQPNMYSAVVSNDESVKVANIHPYTDVIVRNWFATKGLDIDEEFDKDGPISQLPNAADIEKIEAALKNLVAVALLQFQVESNFNLITTNFTADHTGFDMFLDYSLVSFVNNVLSIEVTDINTKVKSLIVSVALNYDLTMEDTDIPSTPQNVRIIPGGDTKLILVWDVASDNIGVAGYEIYREGETTSFATTPHPIFSDTGLSASTEYCYFVAAIDGAGNRSISANSATCGTTGVPPTTPPAQVVDVVVDSVTDSTIKLSWRLSPEDNVIGYYVNRKNGADYINVGTVLSNSFTDSGLDGSTQYCYVVQAFNSSSLVSVESAEACGTTTDSGVETVPPVVTAIPQGGDFTTNVTVTLNCNDGGGSGCAGTYYTLDGSDPSTSSTLYTAAIELSATTVLRFMAIDNAGNESAAVTETYNITLPPGFKLTIISDDVNGVVVSDMPGINCGAVCDVSFDVNSNISLTASHSGSMVAVWVGCTSTALNECNLIMSRDRTVHVSFVPVALEVDPNDTHDLSQTISSANVINGFFNIVNDSDYYSFVVTAPGTFFANISHPSATSFMTLYDSTNKAITSTGGCCGAAVHTLTRSLTPGTYYLQVRSDGIADLVTPYTLMLSGTVLGTASPDIFEENDSFATAAAVTTSGMLQGHLDTMNDGDYFRFEVIARGTFFVTISHPSSTSFMTLYNSTFTAVVNSGGCCGAATHTITQSLDPGIYYVRVLSDSVSNLVDPYLLTFSGTVFGDTSPDIYEENDSFASGTPVTDSGVLQAYLDTANDTDFYRFEVTTRSTFYVTVSHPSATSFMSLYNSSFTAIVNSGGCCGAATHTITQSLDPGTYYVRVLSDSVSNLTQPYSLRFSGTTFGDPTPDTFEENDSFSTAVTVTDNGILQAYLDTANDTDFYTFDVNARSTFFVTISHPSATSFMTLYNSSFTAIVNSGGCCGAATHTITQSLDPGTYYVRILSDSVFDLSTPYMLSFSGTALGGISPDVNEENDSFATATAVSGAGSMTGYLDTANDADFYTFNVTARGTFLVTISHPSATSFMTLYNSSFTSIVNSGGCCGAATHTITQSLDPGTYYVRVLSDSISNLSTPYILTFSGTAIGGTTPDVNEENDSTTNATPITDNANYQGYFDTANDADFFVLSVTTPGILNVNVTHPSATSFVTLYDSSNGVLVSSGGCCGTISHAITFTVDTGIYYVRVLSDGISDLATPYTLSLPAIQ